MRIMRLFIASMFIAPVGLIAEEPVKAADAQTGQVDSVTTDIAKDGTATTQSPQTPTDPKSDSSAVKPETEVSSSDSNTSESGTVGSEKTESPVAENSSDVSNEDTANVAKVGTAEITDSLEGSKQFVQGMIEEIYRELPNKLSTQEVFDYLSGFTTEHFAFTYMSKWSVKSQITSASKEEKDRYLELSKQYMIFVYGEIFNNYYKSYTYKVGEPTKIKDREYSVPMTAESTSKELKDQEQKISIVWRVVYSEKNKRFYIVDVSLNNVSLLLSQEAEFKAMLKTKGNVFGDFLTLMESKITEIKARLQIK